MPREQSFWFQNTHYLPPVWLTVLEWAVVGWLLLLLVVWIIQRTSPEDARRWRS